MAGHHAIPVSAGRTARVAFTDIDDGDFRVVDPTPGLEERRRRIVAKPWSWLIQVHGQHLVRVDEPGQHAGVEGDGLITTATGCPIAVTTADCGPVVLVAERGVAVVHAGWRGLMAGIIEQAGSTLAEGAGAPVTALLGPCIGPGSYEFGPGDLAAVAARYGPEVAATTRSGTAALDLPAGIAAACRAAGWPEPARPPCTSDRRWFSHRVRADQARQTAVAWLEPPGDEAGSHG